MEVLPFFPLYVLLGNPSLKTEQNSFKLFVHHCIPSQWPVALNRILIDLQPQDLVIELNIHLKLVMAYSLTSILYL